VGGQRHAPAALPPRKSTGTQSTEGWEGKETSYSDGTVCSEITVLYLLTLYILSNLKHVSTQKAIIGYQDWNIYRILFMYMKPALRSRYYSFTYKVKKRQSVPLYRH